MNSSSPLTVDARGKACPLPIVELAKALRQAGEGAVVELWATDPAVDPDVRAFCASTGHTLLSLSRDGEHYLARIRKHGRTGAPLS